MIAAISLFVIITISALITKVAAIALMHTGLSTEAAKFQARSVYTGTGFTTQESEKVINHPVRRKVIYILMLVGNAGIVTTISSLMLTFLIPNDNNSLLYSVIFIVVALTALWWAIQSDVVNKWLAKIIDKALTKYTDIDVKDYAAILHLSGEYQISELKVRKDSWLANKTLEELELRKEGINLLGIEREGEEYIGSPNGKTKIRINDIITMYGRDEVFKNLDERERNFRGEMSHQEIIKRQKELVKQKD
ncbi:TrkA C-terminal domain-containing protein [Mesonia aquimarina]|uniref:TrkA C-terminal domain-containing protein n=1 Tax=Mesonia aquimarina TaxID=1504967 RepID=UPI000EF59AB2|nr:TrkA C-terminal domain-containing protein [Mesonia aquimarina]